MKDDPQFWDERIETLSAPDLRAVQEEKFQRQWRYVLENSRFYREKFERAGITPDRIRSLDDLPLLPFTITDELRAAQTADPPLGSHMACPQDTPDLEDAL